MFFLFRGQNTTHHTDGNGDRKRSEKGFNSQALTKQCEGETVGAFERFMHSSVAVFMFSLTPMTTERAEKRLKKKKQEEEKKQKRNGGLSTW